MKNQTRNLVIVALLALLVVVVCWKQSPGQAEGAKQALTVWEYKITVVTTKNDDTSELNKLGNEGWELCSAAPWGGGGQFHTAFLKRPKAAK